MLHFTSLFFTTIVIHAHFLRQHDAFLLFTIVSNLSILYHSLKDNAQYNDGIPFKIILFLDITFARIAFLYFAYKFIVTQSVFSIFILVLFLHWTAVIYISHFNSSFSLFLHGCFHFTSALALHLYLFYDIGYKYSSDTLQTS
jgi:hypothetical protein